MANESSSAQSLHEIRLERRVAELERAIDHADLYLCLVSNEMPTFRTELTSRTMRELAMLLDTATTLEDETND